MEFVSLLSSPDEFLLVRSDYVSDFAELIAGSGFLEFTANSQGAGSEGRESVPPFATTLTTAKGAVRFERGKAFVYMLKSGRPVFVRPSLRGGLIRYLLSDLYFLPSFFSWKKARVTREIALTIDLLKGGVKVPRPIGVWAKRVNRCYVRHAIFFDVVTSSMNLLELASLVFGSSEPIFDLRVFDPNVPDMRGAQLDEAERQNMADIVLESCFIAGRQARLAVSSGVLHVDLHIGNVLVTIHRHGRGFQLGEVFLIDFDGAKHLSKEVGWIDEECEYDQNNSDQDGSGGRQSIGRQSIAPLYSRYLVVIEGRWQKAVAKHGLPLDCNTEFLKGLYNKDRRENEIE